MFLYSKYRRCDIIKERSGNMSINIEQLWDSKDEEMWKEALSIMIDFTLKIMQISKNS